MSKVRFLWPNFVAGFLAETVPGTRAQMSQIACHYWG